MKECRCEAKPAVEPIALYAHLEQLRLLRRERAARIRVALDAGSLWFETLNPCSVHVNGLVEGHNCANARYQCVLGGAAFVGQPPVKDVGKELLP